MPAIVMPQILLGGLSVPREEMAGWLQTISNVLPLTYSIDALAEVGRTSLLTETLLRDLGAMAGATVAALVLGAFTLRRCSGTLRSATLRALLALLVVPLVAVAVAGGWTAHHLLDSRAYVTTDDARIDGDPITLRAPATGTLVDWNAGQGSILHENQPVGRIEINGGFRRPTHVIRAPADGTVVVDSALEGNLVTAGTQLAVAYALSAVRVTARVARPRSATCVSGSRSTSTSTPIPMSRSPAPCWRSMRRPPASRPRRRRRAASGRSPRSSRWISRSSTAATAPWSPA